jgi:hypothetical protein
MQEVKGSLDNVTTNFELIEIVRVARIAAAEELRTLLVEKQTIAGYTVERLDLELNRQESLAQKERDEVAALTDYHTAIADLYAAMGKSLDRNRINFVVPDADEVFLTRTPMPTTGRRERPEGSPSIPSTTTPSPAPAQTPPTPLGEVQPEPQAPPAPQPEPQDPAPEQPAPADGSN